MDLATAVSGSGTSTQKPPTTHAKVSCTLQHGVSGSKGVCCEKGLLSQEDLSEANLQIILLTLCGVRTTDGLDYGVLMGQTMVY